MTTQISLSIELVCLLNWLLKNEKNLLHSLVKQAVERGLLSDLQQIDVSEQLQSPEFLYTTLTDFLDLLEQALIKNLETINVDTTTRDAILPALQKIETDSLDFKTVWLSMQQTKARINKKQRKSSIDGKKILETTTSATLQDPMNILFEELLKNWKPNNKETLN